MADKRQRERFTPEELACCLSHYDLGVIVKVVEFPRGSRRSPKVIIECEKGRYLLKRRAHGKERIKKVAFTHQIQLALAAQNFPLPHLLGTRKDNNSLLVYGENIYEMQEFIQGDIYDGSSRETEQGGHALGLYHKLLEHFESDFDPLHASYHNARAIHKAVLKSGETLLKTGDKEKVEASIDYMEKKYRHCAESVNRLGIKKWPEQIVHGDWHPGNMLFRNQLVVAVIDYDTARLQQRIIDLANGALQFSILGGGDDPNHWPEHLDMKRFRRFLHGYDSVNVITTDELKAIPYLMCEAMIAEAVFPISVTGSFGRFDGNVFLAMIQRKIKWIYDNMDTLQSALDD